MGQFAVVTLKIRLNPRCPGKPTQEPVREVLKRICGDALRWQEAVEDPSLATNYQITIQLEDAPR